MEKPQKNHPFFAILFSKVRGSVRFLGGSVGSRFGSQEQTEGSVGSRFGFWRFGRFEVWFLEVRKVRGLVFSGSTQHYNTD